MPGILGVVLGENILAVARVIHVGEALAMRGVCLFPTGAYIWTTSWHINHRNGSNMHMDKGHNQFSKKKTAFYG